MWVRPSSYESRKVKGVNESDEEKYLRKARRHQKFGKLAELLSEEFKQPCESCAIFVMFYFIYYSGTCRSYTGRN